MAGEYDVLESIAKVLPIRDLYIELGVSAGGAYSRLAPLFSSAIAVDIAPECEPHIKQGLFFNMTTDDFFAQVGSSLSGADMIFIDANHDHEFSWRDFQNSAKIIKPYSGLIILHDAYPPSTAFLTNCSDTYKTAIKIRELTDWESATIPGAFGLTICRFCPEGGFFHW